MTDTRRSPAALDGWYAEIRKRQIGYTISYHRTSPEPSLDHHTYTLTGRESAWTIGGARRKARRRIQQLKAPAPGPFIVIGGGEQPYQPLDGIQ